MYLKRIHSNPMFAYMTGKRQTGSDVEPKNIKQYLYVFFSIGFLSNLKFSLPPVETTT